MQMIDVAACYYLSRELTYYDNNNIIIMLHGSPVLHLITAHIKHCAKDSNIMWDQ